MNSDGDDATVCVYIYNIMISRCVCMCVSLTPHMRIHMFFLFFSYSSNNIRCAAYAADTLVRGRSSITSVSIIIARRVRFVNLFTPLPRPVVNTNDNTTTVPSRLQFARVNGDVLRVLYGRVSRRSAWSRGNVNY